MTISGPGIFHKRDRATLSEEVAHAIKSLIITDCLNPGDQLPTEQELAERFKVSRTTIREGIKMLSFLGILIMTPNRRLIVGDLKLDRLAACLGFHFALRQYSPRQLLAARQVIEIGALPFVAEQMIQDADLYHRLSSIIMSPLVAEDPEHYINADIAFHEALVEASGIEPLKVFDDMLHVFFCRFREQAVPSVERMRRGIEFHQQIIDALRDRQARSAQRLMSEALRPYESRPTRRLLPPLPQVLQSKH